MRLTTKGRYAVTAMLDIALHSHKGPVSVVDIAERQGISPSYLEQLFGRLKRAGLLASLRGPGGGYQITRDADDISVSQIVAAVGEGVDATRCHGAADCQDGLTCLTHDLWSDLSQQIDEFMTGITLGSLVSRSSIRLIAQRQDLKLEAEPRRITALHL
ncbi:MAG: Rrf2 family transcriptional regulator [Proteobacteria bacterium]|nr:Rrf2 family transcriptional regulator [Pseudomonadota bacterium]